MFYFWSKDNNINRSAFGFSPITVQEAWTGVTVLTTDAHKTGLWFPVAPAGTFISPCFSRLLSLSHKRCYTSQRVPKRRGAVSHSETKEIERDWKQFSHKFAIQTLDFQHPDSDSSMTSPCWSWWIGVTQLPVQGQKTACGHGVRTSWKSSYSSFAFWWIWT